MEQVNNLELKDETVFPDDAVLQKALAASYRAYQQLLGLFEKHGLKHEWRYYKDGKAWLCKVQKKAKTVIWMSAWTGYMKATIYFPERYAEGILGLPISEEARESIRNDKNVGKSKPCTFEIRDETVLKDLETVLIHKMTVK